MKTEDKYLSINKEMLTRYLVCLLLFGLFGCSNESVTTLTEAQNKTNLNNSIPSVKPTPESPVKPVGHFTNAGSDGEHQWGFSVELWRQDDKIYGWISGNEHTRLIGNAPPAILEDLMFDPKTQKFSFTAKLPPTIFNGKALPSDIYKFDGILTKKKLVGNQTIIDESCPDICIEKKKITLLRSKDRSSDMEEFRNFGSYQEWKVWMDKIL